MDRKRVLEGVLDNLPDLTSRTFRVFFSSTFTDMTVERNRLMKEVLPVLRDHCRKSGYDFQVVDMRWGVREEALVEQKTTEYCLKEVQICRRVSCGPYFVAFLGDKYGYCPLPSSIPAAQFKTLYRQGSSRGLDLSLLDKWYTLDNNASPAAYTLQPITHHLPHYNSQLPQHQHQQEEDRKTWKQDSEKLGRLLQQLAQTCREAGQISEEDCNKYFASVTEMEVLCGLEGPSVHPERVLLYHRTLLDINVTDSIAWRYTDLDEEGNLDAKAQRGRELLISVKIPALLPNPDIIHHSIPWDPEGINETVSSHDSYLAEFCESFKSKMLEKIDGCLSSQPPVLNDELYQEVLHHLHFGLKKCQNFVGREDIMETLHRKMMSTKQLEAEPQKEKANARPREEELQIDDDYGMEDEEEFPTDGQQEDELSQQRAKTDERKMMQEMFKRLQIPFHFGDEFDDVESDPKRNLMEEFLKLPRSITVYHQPLIVCGSSGSGKTALMAKVAQQSKSWLPDAVCILRFLGTSPKSSTITEVLRSLCQQLLQLYNVPLPQKVDLDVEYQTLIRLFAAILWKADTSARPLVIILDSIDQLQPDNHAHSLNWLPLMLPPTVHLILSLLPDQHRCLEKAKAVLPDASCYVEVAALTTDAAEQMIKAYTRSVGRSLQSAQRKLLLQQFERCPQPLYLKLLIDRALGWRSQDMPDASELGDSVPSAINKFFDQLEHVHGRILVTKALGYLCAARHGLSDTEMDDLLSLDDEVLQDTYLYHLPPDPLVIRLPPTLWLRIRNDMAEYLVERQSGLTSVVNWYHRQFAEVAAMRYLPAGQRSGLHAVLADLFRGTFSDKVKPLELFKVKKGSFPEAMRQVPSQPVQYAPGHYNLRKLYELPHHLVQSAAFEEFCETMTCSFPWLLAKCQALSLSAVFEDFKAALQAMEVRDDVKDDVLADVKYIYSLLLLASDVVQRDPKHLAAQIVGRLHGRPGLSERVRKMVGEARTWLEGAEQSHLVPTATCAPAVTGLLLNTLVADVFLQGADRDTGNYMAINESQGNLLVVQRKSKEKDSICTFDLHGDGQLIKEGERTDYVRYIQVAGKGRYLIKQIYKKMSKYEPSCCMRLTDVSSGANFEFGFKITCLAVSPSGKLVVYTPEDGQRTAIGKIHPDKATVTDICQLQGEPPWQVCCLLFSPDESTVATIRVSKDKAISFSSNLDLEMWSVETGEHLGAVVAKQVYSTNPNPMSPYMTPAFFTPDGSRVIVGYSGSEFKIGFKAYSVPSLDLVKDALFKEDVCAYSADIVSLDRQGEYFMSATCGTSVVNGVRAKHAQLHRMQDAEVISGVMTVNGPMEDIQLAGSDTLYGFLALWGDTTIYVVSFGPRKEPKPTAELIRCLNEHSRPVLQLLVNERETQLLSAGADNVVKVWNFQEAIHPQDMEEEAKNPGSAVAAAITEDGDHAFVATKAGQLLGLNVADGTSQCLAGDLEKMSSLLVSRCQTYLMCAAMDVILVVKVISGEVVHTLTPRAKRVSCMSEGNKILVAGTAGMEARGRIWNIETGEVVKDVEFLYSFYDVAMNSTGTRFGVTFFECPFPCNVEGEAGFIQGEPDSMMTSCSCLKISPDDKILVSCATDGSIRQVAMSDGRYICRMQMVSSAIAAAFSPDSKILVTTGYRSAYLWSTRDGHPLYKVTHHSNFVTGVQFAQGSRFLVTWSHDHSIVVWDLQNKAPVCTFLAHCALDGTVVAVAINLSRIIFGAQRAAPAGMLVPNGTMKSLLENRFHREVSPALTSAQALALAFSSQKVARKTSSSSCTLL